ncbi:MAG: hypothetical protein MJZ90_06750 [Bacteroidales bacterium]|nr:hypothetical protein [Bacteroidales bacterium]
MEIKMGYLEFREKLLPLGCFNLQQARVWFPDLDRTNITRWVKNGHLIKLRQNHYAFAECRQMNDFEMLVANKIYQPSYISLHSALAFYGMIPEMVVQKTSVTTLKTARFTNDFGEFSYNTIKSELFFGYEPKPLKDNRSILFATPEKALLDLLYLFPFYNTAEEIEELRLDEYFMKEELDRERLNSYLGDFHCKALENRIEILSKIFDYD